MLHGRDFSDLSLISPFTPLGMFLTRGGDNGRDKGEMKGGIIASSIA
jgi:hypothetical protein